MSYKMVLARDALGPAAHTNPWEEGSSYAFKLLMMEPFPPQMGFPHLALHIWLQNKLIGLRRRFSS